MGFCWDSSSRERVQVCSPERGGEPVAAAVDSVFSFLKTPSGLNKDPSQELLKSDSTFFTVKNKTLNLIGTSS